MVINPYLKKFIKIIAKGLYWLLPFLIIYFVFRSIDFNKLWQILKQVKKSWLLIGFLIHLNVMVIGGLRWYLLIEHFYGKKLTRRFVILHYWIGSAVGYFAPAFIGWDIYRFIVIGKKLKRYSYTLMSIISEKVLGVYSCIVLIFMLSFFLPRVENHLMIGILYTIDFIMLFSVLLFFTLMIIKDRKWLSVLIKRSERLLTQVSSRISQKSRRLQNLSSSHIDIYEIWSKPNKIRTVGGVMFLSFMIYFVSAIRNNLFFQAMDYPFSIWINLFLAPLFFIIFFLPISFGGIGIREGTFILFYGFFGVPAENALLISFLNLSCIVLSNVIGAVLLFINNLLLARKITDFTPS